MNHSVGTQNCACNLERVFAAICRARRWSQAGDTLSVDIVLSPALSLMVPKPQSKNGQIGIRMSFFLHQQILCGPFYKATGLRNILYFFPNPHNRFLLSQLNTKIQQKKVLTPPQPPPPQLRN